MTMTHRPLTILVTAGPTREPIDPVRFISNRSTGAMGLAIVKAASRRGHKVILISGHLPLPAPKTVRPVYVETARQMRSAVLEHFAGADIVIMAAAVSDYRPAAPKKGKIKKEAGVLNLQLVKNPDILAGLGERKQNKILVGFALETENLYKNALKKLKEKNLDIIVANQLSARQNVFGSNKTSVLILDKDGGKKYFNNVSKGEVARELIVKVELSL